MRVEQKVNILMAIKRTKRRYIERAMACQENGDIDGVKFWMKEFNALEDAEKAMKEVQTCL